MRVLSLDLDFFLNKVHLWGGEGRLDPEEFVPWAADDVVRFLEAQCGLSRAALLPGRFAVRHDACFHYWKELIDRGDLRIPFEVVHVDAHADLGIGDDSYEEIMGCLLHLPPEERCGRIARLNEGNFLAYAAACRWTSSILHVTPPGWGGRDANFLHFRDYDEHTGVMEMKRVDPDHLRRKMARHDYFVKVEGLEPPIPYGATGWKDFMAPGPFDFVFLCQSPEYTPTTADGLLDVIRGYFREG